MHTRVLYGKILRPGLHDKRHVLHSTLSHRGRLPGGKVTGIRVQTHDILRAEGEVKWRLSQESRKGISEEIRRKTSERCVQGDNEVARITRLHGFFQDFYV
jgi:hypothetical protein